MAETTGLLNRRRTQSYHEFESRPLRHKRPSISPAACLLYTSVSSRLLDLAVWMSLRKFVADTDILNETI